MEKIVHNIDGLIVYYKGATQTGFVLLHNRHIDENFDSVIKKYMEDKKTIGYWFARFQLSALKDEIQDKLRVRVFKEKKCKIKKMPISKYLIGKIVKCDVMKELKWHVLSMHIDFSRDNLKFSKHRKSCPVGWRINQKKTHKDNDDISNTAFGRRMYRKHLKTSSNIGHPFRG